MRPFHTGGGGLDAAAERDVPQLGRRLDVSDTSYACITPWQSPCSSVSSTITDDCHAGPGRLNVHGRRRSPGRRPGPPAVGRARSRCPRTGPGSPRCPAQPAAVVDLPHQRVVGLAGVELHQLADVLSAGCPARTRWPRRGSPRRRRRPRRRCRRRSRTGTCGSAAGPGRGPTRPSPAPGRPSWRSRRALVVRDRVLDRHVVVADVGQQLVVPARGVEDQLGVDLHRAVGGVAAVELDDVELRVLAALDTCSRP